MGGELCINFDQRKMKTFPWTLIFAKKRLIYSIKNFKEWNETTVIIIFPKKVIFIRLFCQIHVLK